MCCCDCGGGKSDKEEYRPQLPEDNPQNDNGGSSSNNIGPNPSFLDPINEGGGSNLEAIGIGKGKRRIRKLWAATGFDLAIFPNGKVRGTQSPRNKYENFIQKLNLQNLMGSPYLRIYQHVTHGVLMPLVEFEAAGLDGQLRIKGTVTGFYVTMTPKGRVHAQPLSSNRGTIWVESALGSGTQYHSLLSLDYAHHGYYLGIKKSGKPKGGPKTVHPYPQKAISFISRIVSEE